MPNPITILGVQTAIGLLDSDLSLKYEFAMHRQRIAPKVALGTHSMRKTRGCAMHKAGRSIESIAKVLNHSSPGVTMRYIGLVQQDIDESYADFEL